MDINENWTEPCKECGALDSCCATAKARGETATSLAKVVYRQSETITKMQRDLDDARKVISDLRGAKAPA